MRCKNKWEEILKKWIEEVNWEIFIDIWWKNDVDWIRFENEDKFKLKMISVRGVRWNMKIFEKSKLAKKVSKII